MKAIATRAKAISLVGLFLIMSCNSCLASNISDDDGAADSRSDSLLIGILCGFGHGLFTGDMPHYWSSAQFWQLNLTVRYNAWLLELSVMGMEAFQKGSGLDHLALENRSLSVGNHNISIGYRLRSWNRLCIESNIGIGWHSRYGPENIHLRVPAKPSVLGTLRFNLKLSNTEGMIPWFYFGILASRWNLDDIGAGSGASISLMVGLRVEAPVF